MKRYTRLPLCTLLILTGCGDADTVDTPLPGGEAMKLDVGGSTTESAGAAATPLQFTSDVAIEGLAPLPFDRGDAMLNGENTSITFIGTKPGDNPEPKHGRFEKLGGAARINPATNELSMIFVQIQMDSVTTDIDKLTEHLKGPDFFEVREYGTAIFNSTSITPGENPGEANVTGDLTLHGVTKSITFPAQMQADAGGFAMKCEFTIDRTEFGIDYGENEISHEVAINVTVGNPPESGAQSSTGDN